MPTDNNRVKAGRSGVVPILINALNTHMKDEYMSHTGCDAIMSITIDNGNYFTITTK